MLEPAHRCLLSRLLLGLALAVTTYLTTAELSAYPAAAEINDKLAHVLTFMVLGALMDLSFPRMPYLLPKGLPLLAYGLLIECVQYQLPHRSFSLEDLAADALGLALYGVARFFLRPDLRRA